MLCQPLLFDCMCDDPNHIGNSSYYLTKLLSLKNGEILSWLMKLLKCHSELWVFLGKVFFCNWGGRWKGGLWPPFWEHSFDNPAIFPNFIPIH